MSPIHRKEHPPPALPERLGVAGSGAIACGLAGLAGHLGDVVLWARSPESAERALAEMERRADGESTGVARVVTDLDALSETTFVVEAIAEDAAAKGALLSALHERVSPGTILSSTTSSLSVTELGEASGRPNRFCGLHVFNPVPKMDLIELAFADAAGDATRTRARALCEALGKTPVEVPDTPGFVVNRLLFPYLFSAVTLMEESGLSAADVDACMKLGAAHPLGPLAVLDLVGLDVSISIGESMGADVPERVRSLAAEGALGRKAGRGFHDYSK